MSQPQLQNVLEAYSDYDKEIGYTQGMNYMVAFILMLSGGREKETFWFFNAMLHKSQPQDSGLAGFDGLENLYCKGFPLLLQYKDIFTDLFEELIPDLYGHFEAEGYPIDIQTIQWFQTCFLYSFSMDVCIRIWDNVLAKGTRFMFNVGLAILKLAKDHLMTLEMDAINTFFTRLKEENEIVRDPSEVAAEVSDVERLPHCEIIIKEAQNIEISS